MAKTEALIPFEETLRALLAWLQSADAQGIIIGGLAASILGRPRTTKDIDALILLDDAKWEAFLKLGKRFDFVPTPSDPLRFAQRNRLFRMRHRASGIAVDISLGALPFEEECLKRRFMLSWGNLTIPLVSPEDLIIMKAIAHRPTDLMDIEALVETRNNIDRKRIRQWVKEFSRVLGRSEIFEDLKRLINKPKGPAKRRKT